MTNYSLDDEWQAAQAVIDALIDKFVTTQFMFTSIGWGWFFQNDEKYICRTSINAYIVDVSVNKSDLSLKIHGDMTTIIIKRGGFVNQNPVAIAKQVNDEVQTMFGRGVINAKTNQ